MEEDYIGAQFRGRDADSHVLVVGVPEDKLRVTAYLKGKQGAFIDLDLTGWAQLYWLFVKSGGEKTWLARTIEDMDYYKNLK